MLVVAGSRSDQCPSGALNRTSGPALLAGGHRFGRQAGPHRVGANLRVAVESDVTPKLHGRTMFAPTLLLPLVL